jgi:ABC-type multidrug transport system ATPase subunit/pSer/pThr/pTyr-binding forkhead associated (FHA) protein
MTKPRIIIQEPGMAACSYALDRPCMMIGRDATNDIVIQNPAVSRQHAQLDENGVDWLITDRGSTNGTSVNGRRIMPAHAQKLKDGDIIRIGDQQGNSVGLVYQQGASQQPRAGTIYLGKLAHLMTLPAFTLGRDPSNQVPLIHPSVSRVHARIAIMGQGHELRDLNSGNGTFVNGHRLQAPAILRAGDVIQIGPFKLVYDPQGLSQYAREGNYRLDGIDLTRRVRVPESLPQLVSRAAGHRHVGATKLILNDVSLSIYPKEFVALVGGSGAGKSTLMKALSGIAPAEGQVLVNGDDLYTDFGAYQSIFGYVPQDDIIHGGLIVRDALSYAAQLRLPDATPEEISQRVDSVLDQVDMKEHADKQVNRLSGGQRKRVSIAVELLAEPGLFFLDEPTSGLDPGLEKKMMYTLRQLADGGRTVVLVTHATANITQCTHVGFMADGRLVFFGPPQDAISFFGAHDFADIYTRLSQPIDPVKNPLPAQYPVMLNAGLLAGGNSSGGSAAIWEGCFRASPYYQQNVASRLSGISPRVGLTPVAVCKARQHVSSLQQLSVLMRRYFDLIRRDTMSLFILLAVMPIIGLLLLLMANPFDLTGKTAGAVRAEIQAEIDDLRTHQVPLQADAQFSASYVVVGSAQKLLFMLALAANLLGTFGAAYEIVKEDAIYRRERMVNLRLIPYLLSKIVVLAVFGLVQCFLLLLVIGRRVTYPDHGVLMPATLEMYVTLVLATLASICLGLLISSLARSADMVIYVILLILFVQIIFAGAIFDLPAAAKPISYLTTTRWTLEALGNTVDMEALEAQGVTCIEFEDQQMRLMLSKTDDPCTSGQMRQPADYEFSVNYTHSRRHLIECWLVLLGFAGAFGALAYTVQKRKDTI